MDNYPRFHLLSDGKMFLSGYSHLASKIDLDIPTTGVPTPRTWDFTVGRTGSVWQDARHDGASVFFARMLGGALLDVVVRLGGRGNNAATDTAEFCQASLPNAGWAPVPVAAGSSTIPGGPRMQLNAVILPDASVLVIGGVDPNAVPSAVLTTALYRPGIGWQTQPNTPTERKYHATAVLLPDGRVFVGGGEGPHPSTDRDYDIFSPHYLQGSPLRPTIVSITDSLGAPVPTDPVDGTFLLPPFTSPNPPSFTLECSDIADMDALDKIVLMAPGSITHHSDMSARYVELSSVAVPNENTKRTFTTADTRVLPRGFYMMFALNTGGIPSVAASCQDPVMTRLFALFLFAGSVPAQELLWQLYSLQDAYTGVADSFGDLNHDGYDDLLAFCRPSLANGGGFSLRVLSGVDGSVLDAHTTLVARTLAGVGDFDGDGYPDYAMMSSDGVNPNLVEVWSPHLHQQLLLLSGSRAAWFGGIVAGRVDLDGDGRSDLLVGSTYFNTPDVRAYDHFGTLRYRIPLAPLGAVVLDILGFPDIDGDGCSDFLVGGIEYTLGYSRGYIALLSGRTGSLIRVTYDQQVSDLIGYPLRLAGDMDRDGTPDYLTGNYWGGVRALITAYSGATGAVIRQWTATTYGISAKVIGGRDADLDGVVDVIGGSSNYPNASSWQGRVHVFSSRDQQELMHVEPLQYTYSGLYCDSLSDLGVQPGSPYPVFALTEDPLGGSYGGLRIQVWRCTPPGVRITGTGCSSTGFVPTIGVRRVETPAGEQSRIVLGSAPANAFAWCAVAAAAETTFAGLALPIALDPFGYPGCSLLVPAVPNAPRTVGSSGFDCGYAEVNLTRPLVATGGYGAAAQWLVFDPATSGFASTARCEFRVQ